MGEVVPNFKVKDEIKNKMLLKRQYMFFAVILCSMALISATVNSRGLLEGIVFGLFQVGSILLPGMALMSLLYIKELTGPEQLLFSYGIGYCLNIGLYFLIMFLGLKSYIKVVFLVVVVISFIILCKEKTQFTELSWKENINLLLLLGSLFGFTLIVFARRWNLPTEQKAYFQDLLFWVGDAIALKEKFVPINFRVLLEGYKYHYFGAMQVAVVSMVTDIVTYDVAIFYSFIESVVFLALTFYCFAKRFVRKPKFVFLTLFLMLCSTGKEVESVVTYIWHIYIVPMSYNIALCIELMIILLVFIQHKKEKVDKHCMILSCVLMMVCTGMKGPAGAIALCVIVFFCIYWFFVKREIVKSVVYGSGPCIAFAIVYFLLLANTNQNYIQADISKEQNVSVVEENVAEDGYNGEMEQNSVEVEIEGVMLRLKDYAIYYSKINPWTFIPALFVFIFRKRKKVVKELLMLCTIFVGTFLGCFINYVGSSQMYFTMSVYPLAAVLAGVWYQEIISEVEKRITNKRIGYVIGYTIVVCLMLGSGIFSRKWEYGNEATRAWEKGITGEQQYFFDKSIMTVKEYEAYSWVRENIKNDALILSDRALEEDKFSYIPGVFTERHIYYYNDMEWGKGHLFYSGNLEAWEYFKERNIDYVLVTKRLSQNFYYDKTVFENIYSNTDVDVYKVL